MISIDALVLVGAGVYFLTFFTSFAWSENKSEMRLKLSKLIAEKEVITAKEIEDKFSVPRPALWKHLEGLEEDQTRIMRNRVPDS